MKIESPGKKTCLCVGLNQRPTVLLSNSMCTIHYKKMCTMVLLYGKEVELACIWLPASSVQALLPPSSPSSLNKYATVLFYDANISMFVSSQTALNLCMQPCVVGLLNVGACTGWGKFVIQCVRHPLWTIQTSSATFKFNVYHGTFLR